MRTSSLTFIGFALAATLVHAQAPPAPASGAQAPGTPGVPAAAAKTVAEKAEDAAEPQGYTYNADGRRDPFISLLRRGATASAAKVAGLGGLGTGEVSLRGVVNSEGAFVGILQGIDSKNYIVRVGDRLSDGTIRSITKDSMVILQQVNDPLSLEKEREVRKLLRQTEEAK